MTGTWLIATLALLVTSGAHGAERFKLIALEVATPEPASEDGRFRIETSARLQSLPESRDRFRLKTALVDCGNPPLPELLVDGFEG